MELVNLLYKYGKLLQFTGYAGDFNAIQLRSVDLRRVYKRKIIKVYVSIFSPMLYSVWQKAEKLSILLELRGFRKLPVRTYYRDITFGRIDYVVMVVSLLMTAIFIYAVRGL
jgi:energy-coupling factor transporter transmembrane protein EcfT